MEERRTFLGYLAQVMVVYGFSMLVMNLFCLAIGDLAKGFSTMFSLGAAGVPVGISLQYLAVSALIVGIRFIFFTDALIRKMPVWLRTIGMLACVLVVIVIFVLAFGWFPVDSWQPWVMFFLCFGISFLGSYLVMAIKEKSENRRMEEALRHLKEREEEK